MMKWEKLGCIFDPQNIRPRPYWMHAFAQAPNAVVCEQFVRVFFCCRPPIEPGGQYVSRCAFLDLDLDDPRKILGISEKPVLSLGGLGEFDEFGTYPVSVHKNGDQWVALYGGWSRAQSVPFNISLGLAFSDDQGQSFQRAGCGPVLSYDPDEPFVITSPKLRRFGSKWHLVYTAGRQWLVDDTGRPEIIYKLRLATSVDLIHWDRCGRDIIDSRLGEEEAQACGDVFFRDGTYHMHFCYRKAFNFRANPLHSYRIGYAQSSDGMIWQRDDQAVDLNVSADGWDSLMVAYPNVFEARGRFYMLYAGNGNGATGFGLARLVESS